MLISGGPGPPGPHRAAHGPPEVGARAARGPPPRRPRAARLRVYRLDLDSIRIGFVLDLYTFCIVFNQGVYQGKTRVFTRANPVLPWANLVLPWANLVLHFLHTFSSKRVQKYVHLTGFALVSALVLPWAKTGWRFATWRTKTSISTGFYTGFTLVRCIFHWFYPGYNPTFALVRNWSPWIYPGSYQGVYQGIFGRAQNPNLPWF